jgi:Protein of unknown function (DUF3455)
MTMKRTIAIAASLALAGCSGDDTTAASSPDASTHSDATADTGTVADSSGGPDAASDTGTGADADAGSTTDAADDACPAAWTTAPSVAPAIELPADGGGVLLHAGAIGTQDYTCEQVAVDGGTAYAWVFVGPEADLADCHAAKIGRHFASDAGAAAPEWQTTDGTYVVGKKLAAFTPDGGATAIPWLLVQETSNGGAGTLSKAGYVQRLNTTGGIAPAVTCDGTSLGTTQKVSYTADYFFFGVP